MPMPVTNRHIVMLSGSARNARSTFNEPTGTHENTVAMCSRSSADLREQIEEHPDGDDEGARRTSASPGSRPSGHRAADRTAGSARSRRAAAQGSTRRRRAWLSPSVPRGRRQWRSGLRRRMATMMPRPTTTSAAATTITKNTVVCPPMSLELRLRAATKLRLTALSISSTHISMMSGLRRTSTPTVPMPNSTAASTRYHVVVGTAVGDHDGASGEWLSARRPGQQHGADDSDHQQHRGRARTPGRGR